jgi:hypothetical protein
MAEERTHRRLAAIMAADVAGYSRLIGLDERSTLVLPEATITGWTGLESDRRP